MSLEELVYEYSIYELENLDVEDTMYFIEYETDCLELIDVEGY